MIVEKSRNSLKDVELAIQKLGEPAAISVAQLGN